MSEREAKVLMAEKVYGESKWNDEIPSWWAFVSAGDIAKHVEDGWTVEAQQWSKTPGEALCVVLWREVGDE